MKMRTLIFFSIVCAAATVRAQQPPAPLDGAQHIFQDSLFDRLAGSWSMVGAVRSTPAHYALTVAWVLHHQYLKLEMRDAARPPAYEADVYIGYDFASERYVAHWIDVFGGRVCETLGYGRRDGESVRLVFEYPDGPFRTTLTLNPDGSSWSILMRDKSATGEWREFAHYTLTRQ